MTTGGPSMSELDFNSYEMKVVASTSTEIVNHGVNSPGAVVYTAAITDNVTQGRHRPLQLKPENSKPNKMLTNCEFFTWYIFYSIHFITFAFQNYTFKLCIII